MRMPLVAIVLAVGLQASPAAAQDAETAPDRTAPAYCDAVAPAVARTPELGNASYAFDLALAAVRDERFADAARLFLDSFNRSGNPVALFNMGLALRSLNLHREARDAFCNVVRDPALTDEPMRAEARTLADEQAALVATVSVVAVVPESARFTLDGAPIDVAAGTSLAIDADVSHHLHGEAEGFLSFERDLLLTAGGLEELRLELEPVPQVVDPTVGIVLGVVAAVLVAGATPFAVWAGYESAQLAPTYPDAVFRL